MKRYIMKIEEKANDKLKEYGCIIFESKFINGLIGFETNIDQNIIGSIEGVISIREEEEGKLCLKKDVYEIKYSVSDSWDSYSEINTEYILCNNELEAQEYGNEKYNCPRNENCGLNVYNYVVLVRQINVDDQIKNYEYMINNNLRKIKELQEENLYSSICIERLEKIKLELEVNQ